MDRIYMVLGSDVNNGFFDVMLKGEGKKDPDIKIGEVRVGGIEQQVRQMVQDYLKK